MHPLIRGTVLANVLDNDRARITSLTIVLQSFSVKRSKISIYNWVEDTAPQLVMIQFPNRADAFFNIPNSRFDLIANSRIDLDNMVRTLKSCDVCSVYPTLVNYAQTS